MANTFLLAENKQVGESLAEADEINAASELLALAKEKGKQLLLPTDVLIGEKDAKQSLTKVINELSSKDTILISVHRQSSCIQKSLLKLRRFFGMDARVL